MAQTQTNEEVRSPDKYVVNARGELDFADHAKEVERVVAEEKQLADEAKRKLLERRIQEERS